MRSGINIVVTVQDRDRLEALVAARGAPRKHVWRARITLLTDEGLGTVAIMATTGTPREAMKCTNKHMDYVDDLLDQGTGIADGQVSLANAAVAARPSVADYMGGGDWKVDRPPSAAWQEASPRLPFAPFLERLELVAPPKH